MPYQSYLEPLTMQFLHQKSNNLDAPNDGKESNERTTPQAQQIPKWNEILWTHNTKEKQNIQNKHTNISQHNSTMMSDCHAPTTGSATGAQPSEPCHVRMYKNSYLDSLMIKEKIYFIS